MSTSVVAIPLAPVLGIAPPPPRSESYAPDEDSAERAAAANPPEMAHISGVRNRQPQSSRNDQGDSTTTSAPSTPTSSEEHEQTDASLADSLTRTTWRRLRGSLQPLLFSQSTNENAPDIDHLRGYDKIKPEKLENHTSGIPRLSALLNSNESFCNYRIFGPEVARILLIKQIGLNQLAEQLQELDEADDANLDMEYRCKSIEHIEGWDSAQRDLLNQIEVKINVYYDLYLKYAQMKALSKPLQRNIRNVHDWMVDNRPLVKGEDNFILHVDDFVSTKKRSEQTNQQGNQIEQFIECCVSRWPCLNFLIQTEKERGKADDPLVHHFSDARLTILGKVLLSSLALCMLLVPVSLLFLKPMTRELTTCVVAVSVLVFMVAMSVVVEARAYDMVIGGAAFCAMLVTFLGNMTQAVPSLK